MLHTLKSKHCLKTSRQLVLTNPPVWVHPLMKHFASLAPSSEVCSMKFIGKVVFSGKVLAHYQSEFETMLILTLSTILPVTPMPLRIVTLTIVGIPP